MSFRNWFEYFYELNRYLKLCCSLLSNFIHILNLQPIITPMNELEIYL